MFDDEFEERGYGLVATVKAVVYEGFLHGMVPIEVTEP
jgi:hypothetical protein